MFDGTPPAKFLKHDSLLILLLIAAVVEAAVVDDEEEDAEVVADRRIGDNHPVSLHDGNGRVCCLLAPTVYVDLPILDRNTVTVNMPSWSGLFHLWE